MNKRAWDKMIYMDCALGLYCPDEAEISAMGTLPPEEHSAADYDALEVREMLTGMAADLKTLFRQGETLNRFSADYAALCPRMMELLRMAGCALSTLYVHGEDLNTAAVSVLELRQLASFHFRKCQQAARVAAGRNETVYVRTSGLELQWAKLLLRLKQTEIRFSRPLPAPSSAPAAVVHVSVKPLQLETAAEPARTLAQPGAIRAAASFRAQRPALRPAAAPAPLPEPGRNSLPQPSAPSFSKPQTAAEEPATELNAEDLGFLKDFAELQDYRASRGLRVPRDIRLSDLFIPYGPEKDAPDSG